MSQSFRNLLFLLGVGSSLFAQEENKAPENEVTAKDLVAHWLQTKRLIAHEAAEWKGEREHINQLLDLYNKELTLLNEELSKSGNNAGLIDEEAEALKKSVKASETARRETIAYLAKIKPRMLDLVARFPNPLQDQLDPEFAALKETEITNATSGDTLRAMLKILQDASRFNRSFAFEEQEISLNNSSYRAKVMYFGLSRAYFQAGNIAGEMLPGEKEWSITERKELLPALKKAFAIQVKESPSAFFKLPLKK